MKQLHPLLLLAVWFLAFAANAMLWPVYLIPFGPLGSLIALAVFAGLAIGALFVIWAGAARAISVRRKGPGLMLYVLAPIALMAASLLFLTAPLVELSHFLLYGPRPR